MHLPSERVHREMRSEGASVWVVPANFGEEIAILIKAPSSSLKAIISGCRLEILLGRIESFLCSAIRIYDVPESPLIVSGVVKHQEEIESLAKLSKDKRSPAFLFNEMDVSVAWADITISEDSALQIQSLLSNPDQIFTGEFGSAASAALDSFCWSTDKTQEYENVVEIPITTVELKSKTWTSNTNMFIGVGVSQKLKIDDPDEGEVLERAVWASLESVFPLSIFKSPNVEIGNKVRELTDILTFHTYGHFMIEAKDLSVLSSGFERDMNRRVSGVKKQIKKAIKQLVGSCKAVSRGEKITDSKGNEIVFDREKVPHCIVLVTEMMHFGEWGDIEEMMVTAMQETGAFFHLMDLREFITILKGSRGKPELFDYNLMVRCEECVKLRSLHVRSLITPNN